MNHNHHHHHHHLERPAVVVEGDVLHGGVVVVELEGAQLHQGGRAPGGGQGGGRGQKKINLSGTVARQNSVKLRNISQQMN